MTIVCVFAGLGAFPDCLPAGGGAENVLLVVNPESPSSLTIGNHYAAVRQIPPQNVVYVSWNPSSYRTDVDTFRRKLLIPVVEAAIGTGAPRRIDYVVYSSDYPWAIDTSLDVKRLLDRRAMATDGPSSSTTGTESTHSDGKEDRGRQNSKGQRVWPKQATQVGSLNGLTSLWQVVLTGDPRLYMSLDANRYVRQPTGDGEVASLGFRSTAFFKSDGSLVDADAANRLYGKLLKSVASGTGAGDSIQLPGPVYFLSMVLGVTTAEGNSVPEVVQYLQRSAAADGTQPTGTIYYMRNDNVRSRARHSRFSDAVTELKRLGISAEVCEGTVPKGKTDVQGAMLGTAVFDWAASGSKILPGAICEHLTSCGGMMSSGHNQTRLSEFLRYGAAGSSGTVTEPYAIQAKFPLPSIHVHYARGCSLAEAFYQSVAGPYQLLIVGDALCQPWATIPDVAVEGIDSGEVVEGIADLKPRIASPDDWQVHHFELFVDGVLVAECGPDGGFHLDTEQMCDGYHELRVVAIEDSAIQTQGHAILPVLTSNHGRQIEVSPLEHDSIPQEAALKLKCEAPGMIGIVVMQNTRIVGRITGDSGEAKIAVSQLGTGPVSLRAVGIGAGGPETNVISAPICFTIAPSAGRTSPSVPDR